VWYARRQRQQTRADIDEILKSYLPLAEPDAGGAGAVTAPKSRAPLAAGADRTDTLDLDDMALHDADNDDTVERLRRAAGSSGAQGEARAPLRSANKDSVFTVDGDDGL